MGSVFRRIAELEKVLRVAVSSSRVLNDTTPVVIINYDRFYVVTASLEG